MKQPDSPDSLDSLDKALSGSIGRFMKTSAEIRSSLEAIKSCPAPCGDGTVTVRASSGLNRRLACPVRSAACPYGILLRAEMNRYIAGVMARIGVPRRHIVNFGERRESYAVSEALKWPRQGFLVLCGRTGSGKSFAAARVIYGYLESRISGPLNRGTWGEAERAGDSVMWRSAYDIAGGRDIAARAGTVSLLVMDGLGREEETKTAGLALCSVISKRYDAKLATVITTELPVGGIRKRYGRFVTDRLAEDTGDGGSVIDCGDVSMRLAGAFEREEPDLGRTPGVQEPES